MNKWDKYFLRQTKEISSLSSDESTKCGAILVRERHPISQGFNGPPKKIRDDLVPNTRDEKLRLFFHAEHNCVLSCSQQITSEDIMYVSGLPCFECLMLMYHVGLRKIYYSNYSLPKMCNETNKKLTDWFLSLCLEPISLTFIDKKELDDKIC